MAKGPSFQVTPDIAANYPATNVYTSKVPPQSGNQSATPDPARSTPPSNKPGK